MASKGDGKLQQAIGATSVPLEKYAAPDAWAETIDGYDETLTINVNASIAVPDVEA